MIHQKSGAVGGIREMTLLVDYDTPEVRGAVGGMRKMTLLVNYDTPEFGGLWGVIEGYRIS